MQKNLETENSKIVMKAENFFLFSDGSLPGTYVEINGKRLEGLRSLVIDWNTKNSMPVINLDLIPFPLPGDKKIDLEKIKRAFSETIEIYDIENPIMDFSEKWIYGSYLIFKRMNDAFTFLLTDRFNLYSSEVERIIPCNDSVSMQNVVVSYLMSICEKAFKELNIPLMNLQQYRLNDLEAKYTTRAFQLNANNLNVNKNILKVTSDSVSLLENPYNDFTEDRKTSSTFYKDHEKQLKDAIKLINEILENKELELETMFIPIFEYNDGYAFDISLLNPSISKWKGFFNEEKFHLLGGDQQVYQLNDYQKTDLSQEYLRFLNRIL